MTYEPGMSRADFGNANGSGGPTEADIGGWQSDIERFNLNLSCMADEALRYRRMAWGRSVLNEQVEEVFAALAEVFWGDIEEPYKRLTRDTTLARPEVAYVPLESRPAEGGPL